MPTRSGGMTLYSRPRARTRVTRRRTGASTSRIRKLERIVRSTQRAAMGYHITVNAATGIDTSGAMFNISNLSHGDTGFSRTGNQICINAISVNWTWRGGDDVNACRMILFKDKVSDGTVPTSVELLQSATQLYQSFPNPNNSTRFDLIRDVITNLSSSGEYNKTYKYYHKFRVPLVVKYPGSSDIPETNGLYIFFVSDSGAIAHPTIEFTTRMVYQQ